MNERADTDRQTNVNLVVILFDKLFPKNKKRSADDGKIRTDLEKAIIDEKNIGSALIILEYQLSYAKRLSGRRGKILSEQLNQIKSYLQKEYNEQFKVNEILSAVGKRVLDADKKRFFQALKILMDQAHKQGKKLNSKKDILAQIIAVFNKQDRIYADSPEKIDIPTQKILTWIYAQLKSNSRDIFSPDHKESFGQYLERSLDNTHYKKISLNNFNQAIKDESEDGYISWLTRIWDFPPPIDESLLKIIAQIKKLLEEEKEKPPISADDVIENTEKYQLFLEKYQKIYESLFLFAYNTLYDAYTHQFKSEVEEAIKKHYKNYPDLIKEKNKESIQEAMFKSFLGETIGQRIHRFLPENLAEKEVYRLGFIAGWNNFGKSDEASITILAEKNSQKHFNEYAKDPKKHANNFSKCFIKAVQTSKTKRNESLQGVIDLILSQATRNLTLLSYFNGHNEEKKQASEIIQKTPLSLLLNLIEEMKWEDTAQRPKIISLVQIVFSRKNFTIRPSDMNENFRKAVLEIGSDDKEPSRLFDKPAYALWKTTNNLFKQIHQAPHNKSTSAIIVRTTEPIDNAYNNILLTPSSSNQPITPVAIVNSIYHSSKMEDKQAILGEHITESHQEQNASTSITN